MSMIGLAAQDDRSTEASGMTSGQLSDADRELWRRIRGHDFEPAGVALSFTKRLARDHGWSPDFTRGAIEEYRRFCFLAVCGSVHVTPSEEVDEVWHLHLTYSRDYWDIWCPKVLGMPLHHEPTAGGAADGLRFARQYAETLALYEARFGPPDIRYWPGTSRRFRHGSRFRIVDIEQAIVIPVPAWMRKVWVRSKGVGERFWWHIASRRVRSGT